VAQPGVSEVAMQRMATSPPRPEESVVFLRMNGWANLSRIDDFLPIGFKNAETFMSSGTLIVWTTLAWRSTASQKGVAGTRVAQRHSNIGLGNDLFTFCVSDALERTTPRKRA
jgi:hypothetical protein